MRLREYRIRNGMTQEQAATMLGIPTRTYQNYEREVREPDSDVLCALADSYGISLDELVGRVPSAVSDEADELAELYRLSTDEGRSAIMLCARAVAVAFPREER